MNSEMWLPEYYVEDDSMSLKDLYEYTQQKLQYFADAWFLFSEYFRLSRAEYAVLRNKKVSSFIEQDYKQKVQRRLNGEPIQYIVGKAYFMDRFYHVGEGVLIPRDDTEVIVRECMKCIRADMNVIDLCAGSGIIGITLSMKCPNAKVYAMEKYDTAFGYLTQNIDTFHSAVHAVQDDVFTGDSRFSDNFFDIIISNPPYILSKVVPTLEKQVQAEPKQALDGGTDGLDFYRGIAEHWIPKLTAGGKIFFEIDSDQAESVSVILKNHGIGDIQIVKDIMNDDRGIFGTKME